MVPSVRACVTANQADDPLDLLRVAIGMWPQNMALCFPLQSLTAPPKMHVESDVICFTANFLRRLLMVESPGAPQFFVAVEIQPD